jgi:5,5'-dehydrodivanillate O-demethylase
VGPGTPMGNLLRRYWHPVATVAELAKESVMAVKLLGENLALYRAPDGTLGLMAERCPHRGASMAYGIPENGGLRCPYHGWIFNNEGGCVDMPAEPAESSFKHRVRIPAYPVQEMGGLIWAYLGPEPAPLLPRFDLYVRDDFRREIGITRLPCNWVQVMENSLDPTHLEWLHGLYTNYALEKAGKPPSARVEHHEKIAFEVWEYGIFKRRLLTGQTEDNDDWKIGHPIIFPITLALGGGSRNEPMFQIRVPVDDENTLHFWYQCFPKQPGEAAQRPEDIPTYDVPVTWDDGRLVTESISGQDMMVWVTQGAVSDRTTERLGTSDKGIILFRAVLMDQMEKVARGEDPLGVVRDPAVNEPMIEIPRETRAHYTLGEFVPEGSQDVPLLFKRTEGEAFARR